MASTDTVDGGLNVVRNAACEDKTERWRYPRFFGQSDGERAFIKGEDAKHLSTVLRMKSGELVVLCDNNGTDS
ncbi:MAG: hypothetical protein K2N36_07935, partial [Ruminiclostridium sp.]|nr:hypothetical protein [Ruminiclostridium sp.]